MTNAHKKELSAFIEWSLHCCNLRYLMREFYLYRLPTSETQRKRSEITSAKAQSHDTLNRFFFKWQPKITTQSDISQINAFNSHPCGLLTKLLYLTKPIDLPMTLALLQIMERLHSHQGYIICTCAVTQSAVCVGAFHYHMIVFNNAVESKGGGKHVCLCMCVCVCVCVCQWDQRK